MTLAILDIIDMLLRLLSWVIIAQVIVSWLIAFNVINVHSGAVRGVLTGLDRILSPLYRPIRKILPDFGGIDFSPLVLLLAIQILRKLLVGLAMEVSPTLT